MGFYRAAKPLMNALRRRMVTESDKLLEILSPLEGEFTLHTENYRRMAIPDSVPDALRSLYPTKGFYFEKPLEDFALLQSPALAEEVARSFRLLAPMYHYLKTLTPEADADITVDRS